jgi:CheY-like chemotaxis protein
MLHVDDVSRSDIGCKHDVERGKVQGSPLAGVALAASRIEGGYGKHLIDVSVARLNLTIVKFYEKLSFNYHGRGRRLQRGRCGSDCLYEGRREYADRNAYAYPTFITTDLKMPGADGFAVLEHLKNNPEWAVIPTVVFTASRDLDDIEKAYMLGDSSYPWMSQLKMMVPPRGMWRNACLIK